MPSSQKSIFIARLGNVAGLTLAEEAKPIARNKCIESVAQWMRQNAEAGSKAARQPIFVASQAPSGNPMIQ